MEKNNNEISASEMMSYRVFCALRYAYRQGCVDGADGGDSNHFDNIIAYWYGEEIKDD